jgi:hypothetical protein
VKKKPDLGCTISSFKFNKTTSRCRKICLVGYKKSGRFVRRRPHRFRTNSVCYSGREPPSPPKRWNVYERDGRSNLRVLSILFECGRVRRRLGAAAAGARSPADDGSSSVHPTHCPTSGWRALFPRFYVGALPCAGRTTYLHRCVIAVVALTVHGLHPITAIVCLIHQRFHADADAVSEASSNTAESTSARLTDHRSQYRVDSDAE